MPVPIPERLPGALAEVGEGETTAALLVPDIAAMEEAAEASLVHAECIAGDHHEARPFIGEKPERGVLPVAEEHFRRDAIELARLHSATLRPPGIRAGQMKQEARANRTILVVRSRGCPVTPKIRARSRVPFAAQVFDCRSLRVKYLCEICAGCCPPAQ